MSGVVVGLPRKIAFEVIPDTRASSSHAFQPSRMQTQVQVYIQKRYQEKTPDASKTPANQPKLTDKPAK